MLKLLAYPVSFLYYCFFSSCLLFFHPLQVFCLRWINLNTQKKTVDILNFFILRCLNLLGTRIIFKNTETLPQKGTLIFAANHQSTYDIPPLIWYLRKYHPKFVAKKELGKGLPSISYHLRHGGNVLIDRKDPVASLAAIEKFALKVQQNKWSIVIFPEGTRSNSAKPSAFRIGGLKQLIDAMPEAKLVGITINNSWKLSRYGYFPMGVGAKITLKMHPPVDCPSDQVAETLERLEKTITAAINP